MGKPMVYLRNGWAVKVNGLHLNRVGIIMGPSYIRNLGTDVMPYVLDNDKFSVWAKGKDWDVNAYWAMLDKIDEKTAKPLWVVVPDVVGDADATFREWGYWCPYLRERGHTLALAVQDGMTPDSVKRNTDPDVIFVGGTTDWKRKTVWNWCHEFPRVHVGRVNTEKWLWNAHNCGAESTDGTGWHRDGDRNRAKGLHRYLDRTESDMEHPQSMLEFARTFGGEVPKDVFPNR